VARRVERVDPRLGYDLWSESYDRTPNPVVAMDSRHTIGLLAARPGELILDAGCGTGRNLQALTEAGCTAVGIDFSAGMLGVAARKPDRALAVADLHRPLPFRDGCFDAVLCALIGEHLADLDTVLTEFYRVVRSGGRLVFSTYHPAMADAGKEANFERLGVEYRLGAVPHSINAYESAMRRAEFEEIERFEFAGDTELARAIPLAAKYIDFPVLLILRGFK